MRILNFGSLNLDFVYNVNHIVQPGETISSTSLEVYCGGKGLNQSIALARAGAEVYHAGMVGSDGAQLIQSCRDNGVDATFIRTTDERSGNAIIQVAQNGQNSIVLFGGANQKNDRDYIDAVLLKFNAGDWILLQNEVSELAYMLECASKKGMNIALNPSPYNEIITSCDLSGVHLFLLNEVEGEQLTGKTEANEILQQMHIKFPRAKVVLTLGENGAHYSEDENSFYQAAYKAAAIDTTAAGDTFTGYFLAAIIQGNSPEKALKFASMASSIAVSRKGATPSIPWKKEVEQAILSLLNEE